MLYGKIDVKWGTLVLGMNNDGGLNKKSAILNHEGVELGTVNPHLMKKEDDSEE